MKTKKRRKRKHEHCVRRIYWKRNLDRIPNVISFCMYAVFAAVDWCIAHIKNFWFFFSIVSLLDLIFQKFIPFVQRFSVCRLNAFSLSLILRCCDKHKHTVKMFVSNPNSLCNEIASFMISANVRVSLSNGWASTWTWTWRWRWTWAHSGERNREKKIPKIIVAWLFLERWLIRWVSVWLIINMYYIYVRKINGENTSCHFEFATKRGHRWLFQFKGQTFGRIHPYSLYGS